VEVQACGTPVLALDYGGHKETVVDSETGYLFKEQTEQSVIEAVNKFETRPLACYKQVRQNSLRFSEERFRKEFGDFVTESMIAFKTMTPGLSAGGHEGDNKFDFAT
jgi:glycosyltransferase involved in cell wall biosynthesis